MGNKMKRPKAIGIAVLSVFMILCLNAAGQQADTPSEDGATDLVNDANTSVSVPSDLQGPEMSADDILHLTDGTEQAGRLMSFDQEKFAVNVQGDVKEIPRAEVVSIALGQPQLRPKLLYVGSDSDDLANAAVGDALKKAGFDLTSATRLPASLDGFDVVVLESVSASSPEAAKMLRSFVGKGGGAVLVGEVPWAFCPDGDLNDYCIYENGNCIRAYPRDTSSVADWVGGSTMEWIEVSNPRIAVSIANPFYACPDINVGDELYVFEGDTGIRYFQIGSLSAKARPVAKIRYEIGGEEYTGIAAFAYPFGTGRTYYQSMSYEANHPKLVELLVAGAKWAGGVLPEIGG